jgi:hypothetical protein
MRYWRCVNDATRVRRLLKFCGVWSDKIDGFEYTAVAKEKYVLFRDDVNVLEI